MRTGLIAAAIVSATSGTDSRPAAFPENLHCELSGIGGCDDGKEPICVGAGRRDPDWWAEVNFKRASFIVFRHDNIELSNITNLNATFNEDGPQGSWKIHDKFGNASDATLRTQYVTFSPQKKGHQLRMLHVYYANGSDVEYICR